MYMHTKADLYTFADSFLFVIQNPSDNMWGWIGLKSHSPRTLIQLLMFIAKHLN